MTGPGEAISENSRGAYEYLNKLTRGELLNYRRLVSGIAKYPRFAHVDEMMSGFTPISKLQIIDNVLKDMK